MCFCIVLPFGWINIHYLPHNLPRTFLLHHLPRIFRAQWPHNDYYCILTSATLEITNEQSVISWRALYYYNYYYNYYYYYYYYGKISEK